MTSVKGQGLIRRLRHHLTGFATAVWFVAWISLMMVIPAIVLPGLTKTFIDDVLVRGFDGWVGPLLIGLGGVFMLQVLLSTMQELALLRLEHRLALEHSTRFAWHLLRLPIAFFDQHFTGDLVNRLDANDRVARLLARDCGHAVAMCFTVLFLGVAMLLYDPTLGAIAVGGAVLNIAVLARVNRALTGVARRLQSELSRLYAISIVGVQSMETLKASAQESDFFGKWTGHHAQVLDAEARLAALQQASDLVPPFVSRLTAATVLGVGAMQVVEGTLSVGALVAFLGMLVSFSLPIAQLVGTASRMQQASADVGLLDDVLQCPHDWRFPETPPAPVDSFAAGHLSLERVSFAYDPLEAPFIEDFSIDVAPGRWVALIGASGGGKSTVGKLITGLHEPRGGDVRIDGHTLAEWGRNRLVHMVASADQEAILFQGSLRDNVTLWDESITHRTLIAALIDTGLDAFIKNLDSPIEEGGRNLSSGQRQRIEIARALVREPAVLVLDEATSALDSRSESRILNAVRRRGVTCVLITHRLSTVRDCDEIIVLEHGKVVECGTHAVMAEADGPYSRSIRASSET